MTGAMMVRVVAARAMVVPVRMALLVLDREAVDPKGAGSATAVPMVVVRVAMVAGLMALLTAARNSADPNLADPEAIPVVDLADPTVLVVVVRDVVPALVDPADLADPAASCSGWMRLTASSTKSSARLNP
jgi:hypothetical protein